MKIYNKELAKKHFAIAEVSINTAMGISELLLNPHPLTSVEILLMTGMAKEQQKVIVSQPLSITKPDKYGMFKDYRFDGEVVGLVCQS